MGFNHAALFEVVAGAVPEREAIVFRDRRLTFAAVAERANRVASALLERGVRPPRPRSDLANWESGQDHVGVYLHNGNEYLEVVGGANRARAVPFNVNYRYVEHELAYLLNDAAPFAVVYHAAFAPTLGAVLSHLDRPPLLIQVADESGHPLLAGAEDYEQLLAGSSARPPALDLSPDDLYMLYTGGTTGMPKGTLWRQADIYDAAIGGVGRIMGLDETDLQSVATSAPTTAITRFLPAPPFMHGAAGWASLGSLLSGGTVVIQSDVTRFDPADVLATTERERVNSLLVVGDSFGRPICEELDRHEYDLSSLVGVITGGATMSPAVKRRLLDHLPGIIIVDAGGASETGTQMSSLSTRDQTAELGIFSADATTCVVDDELRTVLPAGHPEPGWLARRGAIPLGYLGDRDKTLSTFPIVDGERMSIPGDRARVRADGSIELLGRESMTINTGGEKVFAEEVEQALIAHPDVDDALVVGRPSEKWGTEVVAVVQLRPGAAVTDDQLLEVASQRLARFKLPKTILRVAQVHRSPSGKADYGWAKAQATLPVNQEQLPSG
jgi:3-oxocholest-4-en-26-oate---CoA ligase